MGSTSYASNEGSSVTEGMNMLAETANAEILRSNGVSDIKDGSHSFKSRFIAISRAGNKMISVDQTLQLHHNNALKATLRNKEHQSILDQLALMSTANNDARGAIEDTADQQHNHQHQQLGNGTLQSTFQGTFGGTGALAMNDSSPQKFSETIQSGMTVTGGGNFNFTANTNSNSSSSFHLRDTQRTPFAVSYNNNTGDSDSEEDLEIFNALLQRGEDWVDPSSSQSRDHDHRLSINGSVNQSATNSVDGSSVDSEYLAHYEQQARLFSSTHLPTNLAADSDAMSLGSKSSLGTKQSRNSRNSKNSMVSKQNNAKRPGEMQTIQQQQQQQNEVNKINNQEEFSDFDTQFILSKHIQYQTSSALVTTLTAPEESAAGGTDSAVPEAVVQLLVCGV